MPYTLVKMLVWLVLAVGLGIVTGWLLRSVTAGRQVARARSRRGDAVELERLRERVAAFERERSLAAGAERSVNGDAEPATARSAGTEPTEPAVTPTPTDDRPDTPGTLDPAGAPDVTGASAVLGWDIEPDDLKVVEGIGPTVEELCHGIGIRGWADLAATEVSLLRTMLDDAGARLKVHDPTTWPRQAELLVSGQWAAFKSLTDSLRAESDAPS